MTKVHVMWVPGEDLARDNIVHRIRKQFGADTCLHEDPQKKGLMQNWLSCLECAQNDGNPWSVILSDDAKPYPNTKDELEKALEHSPSRMLGLSFLGAYPEKAWFEEKPYLVGNYIVYGIGIAFRQDLITPLLEWCKDVLAEEPTYPHDDVLACTYMKQIGEKPALVTRALFDYPPLKSLVGHPRQRHGPVYSIEMDGPDWSSGEFSRASGSPKSYLPRRFA